MLKSNRRSFLSLFALPFVPWRWLKPVIHRVSSTYVRPVGQLLTGMRDPSVGIRGRRCITYIPGSPGMPNPALEMLDMLRRAGCKESEIDVESFERAAASANEEISRDQPA